MACQMTLETKPTLANWANKWFFTRVDAKMGLQVAAMGKLLETKVTIVGLGPSVDSLVD